MLYKTIAGDRMSKYGEFVIIDTICLNYNYTHEQVFNLSWSEVMTIIALNKDKSYIDGEMHKANMIQSESNRR